MKKSTLERRKKATAEECAFRNCAALSALRMFSFTEEEIQRIERGEIPNHKLTAKLCFDAADAMLAEKRMRE